MPAEEPPVGVKSGESDVSSAQLRQELGTQSLKIQYGSVGRKRMVKIDQIAIQSLGNCTVIVPACDFKEVN